MPDSIQSTQLNQGRNLADVTAVSQANPGSLISGDTVGNTPTNNMIAPSAIVNQAYTAPKTPLISDTANPNILSSKDANNYVANVQGSTQPPPSTSGIITGTNPITGEKLSYDPRTGEGNEIAVRAANAAAGSISQINSNYQPKEQTETANERSGTLTEQAGAVKGGTAGTSYGIQALNDVAISHQRQFSALEQQKQDAIQSAWQAAVRGSVSDVMQAQNAHDTASAAQDKLSQQTSKTYQDIADAEKATKADVSGTIGDFLKGGSVPNDTQLNYWDQKYGLDSGTSKILLGAAVADQSRAGETDVYKQRDLAVDSAKKLSEYLDTQPIGSKLTLGGVDYYGTGKGNMKSGVEVDKTTGRGMYYEFNPETGQTITTPMGQVGFGDPNWTIQKDDSGQLWRVSASSGDMQKMNPGGTPGGVQQMGGGTAIPMTPGPAQKTNHAVLPEGSIGPTLPGHEANAGQCGAYVQYCYGAALLGPDGNSFTGKQQALSRYPKVESTAIQPGNTFLMNGYGTTGHIGFVGDPVHDPSGKLMGFMADESNFVPPGQGKVSYSRFVSINDPHLTGFYDVPTPNKPPVGSDSPVTMAANGNPTFGAKTASADENKFLTPTEAKDLGVPYGTTQGQAAKMNITPGAATSGQLSDNQEVAAQGLTDYSLDLKNVPVKDRTAVFAAAKAIDPSFDASQYQVRRTFQQSFTSGALQHNLTSLDTAVDHLGELKAAGDTLLKTEGGNTFPALNAISGAFLRATGNASPGNFEEKATAVANELASAFSGGKGGTEGEINAWRSSFNANSSSDQMKGALQSGVDLMSGRVGAIMDSYKKVMGKNPDQPLLSLDRINQLSDLGVDTKKLAAASFGVTAPKSSAPQGQIYVVGADGKRGVIPESEFDPAIYAKI